MLASGEYSWFECWLGGESRGISNRLYVLSVIDDRGRTPTPTKAREDGAISVGAAVPPGKGRADRQANRGRTPAPTSAREDCYVFVGATVPSRRAHRVLAQPFTNLGDSGHI